MIKIDNKNTIHTSTGVKFFIAPLSALIMLDALVYYAVKDHSGPFVELYLWVVFELSKMIHTVVYSVAKKQIDIHELITAINTSEVIVAFEMFVVIFATALVYSSLWRGVPVIENTGWTRVMLGLGAACTINGLMLVYWFLAFWSKVLVVIAEKEAK